MGLNILAWVKAKKYTDNAVSQSAALHREIVTSLPITGDEHVIYMVPVTGSGDDNYNEYMWINNAWELIGNTRVDLTDYYNKTQVDTALSGKANTSDIPTALSDLTADSTHRLVTDTEKSSWSGKADQTTVTIPPFVPSQAGWRRICKISGSDLESGTGSAGTGLIYVGGYWSNGTPKSALLSVNIVYSSASLTLLSNYSGDSGMINAIRLVHIIHNQYWVDVYFPAYSSKTGPHTLKFTGDIEISDIQNPISITTDTTAAAEMSLTKTVSGVVFTGDPIKTQTLNIDIPAVSAGRGCTEYKALPTVSGYKAIGIIDVSPIGDAGTLSLNCFFVNNTSAYISYENNKSSGTAAASVNLTILYMKT